MQSLRQARPRLLLLAAAAMASACSPAPRADDPAATAGASDCAQRFVEITQAAPGCGLALTQAGALLLARRVIADPLVVSYRQDAGGSTAIAAGKVVLFPASPSGRFRVLQACESAAVDALCWKVFVLDGETGRLSEAFAGKYGPERWLAWSPDERHVALVSRNEGASWLHIVETATGRSRAFPGDESGEIWRIEPQTLAWTGPRSLRVMVARCPGCMAAPETIRF